MSSKLLFRSNKMVLCGLTDINLDDLVSMTVNEIRMMFLLSRMVKRV